MEATTVETQEQRQRQPNANELHRPTEKNSWIAGVLKDLNDIRNATIGENGELERAWSNSIDNGAKRHNEAGRKFLEKSFCFNAKDSSIKKEVESILDHICKVYENCGYEADKIRIIREYLDEVVRYKLSELKDSGTKITTGTIMEIETILSECCPLAIDTLAGVAGQNAWLQVKSRLNESIKSGNKNKDLIAGYYADFAFLGLANAAFGQESGDEMIRHVFSAFAIWGNDTLKQYPDIKLNIYRVGGDEISVMVEFKDEAQKEKFNNEYPNFSSDINKKLMNIIRIDENIGKSRLEGTIDKDNSIQIAQSNKVIHTLENNMASIISNLSPRGGQEYADKLFEILAPVRSITNPLVQNQIAIQNNRLTDKIYGTTGETEEQKQKRLDILSGISQNLSAFLGAFPFQVSTVGIDLDQLDKGIPESMKDDGDQVKTYNKEVNLSDKRQELTDKGWTKEAIDTHITDIVRMYLHRLISSEIKNLQPVRLTRSDDNKSN